MLPDPANDEYLLTVHAINPVVEKEVRRKFDRFIMPIVFLSYMFAILDRSNIGNAQTGGMGADLGFDDSQFEWLLTIYYIPYIAFSGFHILWQGPQMRFWAAAMIFAWGSISALQSVVKNWGGMMICRCLLGVAEACFAPGIPVILSYFYRREEIGLRVGIYLSAAPLATSFGGLLAYAIVSYLHSPYLAGWRLLFIAEGIPPVLLAIALAIFLPKSPEEAFFLKAYQKKIAEQRTIMQCGKTGQHRMGWNNIKPKQIWKTMVDPQTIVHGLMGFCCNVSFASLPVFLPTILTTMGFSKVASQGLTAPPYLFAFVVCILSTWFADKFKQRGYIIAALSLVGSLGYILLATLPLDNTLGRYASIFLAAAGVFSAIANILPWSLNNQPTDTARGAGMSIFGYLSQAGPLLGTRMFPVYDGPHYTKGLVICAAFMFLNFVLSLLLRWYYVHMNNRHISLLGAMALADGSRMAVGAKPVEIVDPQRRLRSAGLSEMADTINYRLIL
ncbi:major facilitator superfamily transporter [Lasiosphaeria miniovina]|uniref:Major facilitator superfamily transporter n=1 Tax=Lasiosphaeria miniovina TaxID=1954250 RepID=A0AA40A5G0_9PEZI|nr:major facilitator superfamily transporter [Lasiosphaeria miniovina]KAK0709676.1 major facilitator superfamily transporter [Lasiosphaeria miniovina]